jgi:cellulose synthase operon protein C
MNQRKDIAPTKQGKGTPPTRRRLNYKLLFCLLAVIVVLAPGVHFLHAVQFKRTKSVLLHQAEQAMEETQALEENAKDLKGEPSLEEKKQKSLARALGFWARYLVLDPKDIDARVKYGQALVKRYSNPKSQTEVKGLERGYYILSQALSQDERSHVLKDEKRHEVLSQISELAMQFGKYKEACNYISALFHEGYKKNAKHLALRALCYQEMGLLASSERTQHEDFENARNDYQEAIDLDDKSEAHFELLAYLLCQHADKVKKPQETLEKVYEVADATINDMRDKFKDRYQAYVISALYYHNFLELKKNKDKDEEKERIKKEKEQIEKDVRSALALAPNEPDVLLAAAQLEMDLNKPDNARAFLNIGIGLKKDGKDLNDLRMYQALATLERKEHQPKAAVGVLKRGLEKLPKQLDLFWHLAYLYLDPSDEAEKNNEEAEKIIQGAEDSLKTPEEILLKPKFEYLRGQWLVNKEEWSLAIQTLERSYHQTSRSSQKVDWFSIDIPLECQLLLARCYLKVSDPDQARSICSLIVLNYPQSIAGRFGLARADRAIAHFDESKRAFKDLMNDPAVAPAWQARACIEYTELLASGNLNLKAEQRNWTEVKRLLKEMKEVAKFEPVRVEAVLLEANIHIADKPLDTTRFDEAREFLKKTFEVENRPVEIWVGLANLEQQAGNHVQAVALLDLARQQLGDRKELRLAQVLCYQREDGPLDKLAEGVEKWSKPDKLRLRKELAETYRRSGSEDEYKKKLNEIVAEKKADNKVADKKADKKKDVDAWPNDVETWQKLFSLASNAKDKAEMAMAIKNLKRIEGQNGSLWQFCEASRLILESEQEKDKQSQSKLLAEAQELLSNVQKRRPNWAQVPTAQGNIFFSENNYRLAIDKYSEAVEKGNRDPAVIFRLVRSLAQEDRLLEADKWLKKFGNQENSVFDLTQLAVGVALEKKEFKKAVQLAEGSIDLKSKKWQDHVLLAKVRWAAGEAEKAEAAWRTAIDLNRDSPELRKELVRFLMETKQDADAKKQDAKAKEQYAKAKEAVEAAKTIIGDKAVLHLAICYELIGENKKARAEFNKALERSTDDVEKLQALQEMAFFLLRHDEHKEAKDRLEHIIQIMAKGNLEDIAPKKKALEAVLSLGNYGDIVQALKTHGLVPVAHKADGLAADAKLAEEVAAFRRLARLATQRNVEEAIKKGEDLASRKALDEEGQFVLAELYEARGGRDDWPNAKRAMLRLITEQEEKLSRVGAGSKQALETLLGNELIQFCYLLLKHHAVDEAQIYMDQLKKLKTPASNSFSSVALQAEILIKTDRGADAFSLVTKEADKDPRLLETVSGFCVYILYATTTPSKDLSDRTANWLVSKLEDRPKDLKLLDDLATVRRFQGKYAEEKYAEVVKLYRSILEADDKNAGAMNNLAWILGVHEGNTAEALQMVNKAIELKGKQAAWLDTRAVIYTKLNRFDEAIQDLKEALKEGPTASRCFHLARAYLLAERLDEAREEFAKIQRLRLNENTIDPLESKQYKDVKDWLKAK